jgi:subtilisin family serine protease
MKIRRIVAHAVAMGVALAVATGVFMGTGYSLNAEPVKDVLALSQSPKILADNSALDDFKSGATTARVIVNLRKPARTAESPDLADLGVRQKVREDIRAVLDRVIGTLNPGEIIITTRFVYIYGFAAEVTLKGLQELIGNSDVVSIEKEQILYPHLAQGIPLMNASTVRNTYNGSGVSIAICDTGIDYTHPRLGGGGFPNSKVIGGYDCGENKPDPMPRPTQSHGTCCAGIAAGDLGTVGDYIGGVAYNAKLYAVKISRAAGDATNEAMIAGWEWCITHQNDNPANPIKIISTSFGGDKFSSACDSASPAMTAAAANAVAAGITVFASSGNDGYCDSMGWPACISNVISVGAVYDAAFGNYTPCISGDSCAPTKTATTGCTSGWYATDSTAADLVTSYSNAASFLGVLAPANNAYTTTIVGEGSPPGYNQTFGGTSAACPYAAGAAACLQSAAKYLTGSFLTPSQVKSTLINTGNLITDGKVAITKPRVNLGNAIATLPVPPINLTANKTTFNTTDQIGVYADVAAISTPCYPFIRIIQPNGPTIYFVDGGEIYPSVTPYLGVRAGPVIENTPIPDFPIGAMPFKGIPTGTYYLEGGTVDATRTTSVDNLIYFGTVDRETLTVR